jgi:hypothetical protein
VGEGTVKMAQVIEKASQNRRVVDHLFLLLSINISVSTTESRPHKKPEIQRLSASIAFRVPAKPRQNETDGDAASFLAAFFGIAAHQSCAVGSL